MDMLSQLNSKTKILSFKNDVAVLVLKTTYDSNFTLLVVDTEQKTVFTKFEGRSLARNRSINF